MQCHKEPWDFGRSASSFEKLRKFPAKHPRSEGSGLITSVTTMLHHTAQGASMYKISLTFPGPSVMSRYIMREYGAYVRVAGTVLLTVAVGVVVGTILTDSVVVISGMAVGFAAGVTGKK